MPSRDEVLIVFPYPHETTDAVAAYVRDLVEMLESSGLRVRLLPMQRSTQAASRIGRALMRPWIVLRNEAYLRRAGWVAIRNHRRMRAVIAVDVPVGVGSVGRIARTLSRGRIVTISWVLDLYQAPNWPVPTSWREKIRHRARVWRRARGLRHATSVVTIGSCMASTIAEIAGRESHMIPLWRSPSELSTADAPPHDGLSLLYAGHAGANHPLSSLVEAAERFGSSELSFTLVGRGREADRIAALASPAVTVVAPVPPGDVAELHASADVHVVSLPEAATGTCVPSKTYAAMSAGRACLFLGSADCQAAVDVLAAGAGFVVATDDADGIAQAIGAYRDDANLARAQGKAGLAFIQTHRNRADAREAWMGILSAEA